MVQEKESPGGEPGRGNLLSNLTLILPQAENSEINVLGAIIQEGKLIEKVNPSPSDFYSEKNQIIYSVMKDMERRGVPIDINTLHEEIRKAGKEEITGGFMYLSNLERQTLSTANFDYHVKQIQEASHNRKLWEKSQKLIQAIEKKADRETIAKLGTEIEKLSRPEKSKGKIISLSDYTAQEIKWLLENAIPDKFPSTIYGDGGLGKSYLGLYFATLAALGNQTFLGLQFPLEPLNVLYLDWELDVDEFSRRALMIAKGLGFSKIPSNLHYYSPDKSLYKLLPELKGIVQSKGVQFLIIDSLGASCVDPEDVGDVVEVFSQIKSLGIAALILDHQSKMQSQDNYNQKTPYGSVYKYNLSRSVFQLSCVGREPNQISLMLRHTKCNFGRLLDALIFDILFEGDRVMFLESKALSPEEKDIMTVHEAMTELEGRGEKVNQKNLVLSLRGVLGRNSILYLLDKGEGKFWEKDRGKKREFVYKFKSLKIPPIYNRDFKLLNSEDEIDIPEVIA